jgi:hypothetical protein
MVLFSSGLGALAQHGQGGGKPPAPPAQGQGHGSQGSQATPPRGNSSQPDANRGRSEQSSQSRKTVSEQLKQNTKLSSHLQGMFPAGTDLQQASSGFKNLGQFVAAAHVSNNLNIPFAQLKTTMIGPPERDLGQAIHQIKPDVDSKAEANKAKAQANKVIKETKS